MLGRMTLVRELRSDTPQDQIRHAMRSARKDFLIRTYLSIVRLTALETAEKLADAGMFDLKDERFEAYEKASDRPELQGKSKAAIAVAAYVDVMEDLVLGSAEHGGLSNLMFGVMWDEDIRMAPAFYERKHLDERSDALYDPLELSSLIQKNLTACEGYLLAMDDVERLFDEPVGVVPELISRMPRNASGQSMQNAAMYLLGIAMRANDDVDLPDEPAAYEPLLALLPELLAEKLSGFVASLGEPGQAGKAKRDFAELAGNALSCYRSEDPWDVKDPAEGDALLVALAAGVPADDLFITRREKALLRVGRFNESNVGLGLPPSNGVTREMGVVSMGGWFEYLAMESADRLMLFAQALDDMNTPGSGEDSFQKLMLPHTAHYGPLARFLDMKYTERNAHIRKDEHETIQRRKKRITEWEGGKMTGGKA